MFKKLIEKLYWKNYKENLDDAEFELDLVQELLADLKKVEGYQEFLRTLMKSDKTRYFRANSDEARERIKGEYLRTKYLLKSVRSIDDKSPITQKMNNRYGV